MQRRTFIKCAIKNTGGICLYSFASSWTNLEKRFTDDSGFSNQDIIWVPDNPAEWNSFREKLKRWRTEERKRMNYENSPYRNKDFQWVSSAYNCYFLMMYDERFYDSKKNQYSLDKFISNAVKDFGRLDIIVLWHAYPRLGLDDRNQFDFYRDMPGGLEELRKISDYFHSKNIKVFVNYNPWDTKTRRESCSDIDALIFIIKAINADGLFLDTMHHVSSNFREKLDQTKPGIALESEMTLPLAHIPDHHLSWAQWFSDSLAPGILRNKWFEPRHMQHSISRWHVDRTKELHTAWMNGSGILIWENVFGQWLGWNERDKSILRIISPIQKRYATHFYEGEWTPMADANPQNGVYANLWTKNAVRLWTLVNRSEKTVNDYLLHLEIKTGEKYYDLIRGVEVKPRSIDSKQGVIEGNIPARNVGCFIAVEKQTVDKTFLSFLQSQTCIHKTLSDEHTFSPRTIQLKPFAKTPQQAEPPQGMLPIPSVKKNMKICFRVREIGYYESIEQSFLNAVYPHLHQIHAVNKQVNIRHFAIDETPVTNKQFKIFMESSNYQPEITYNFLKHWINGNIPEGKEDHPVVYVDIQDARNYAAWAGKRLPSEEEWQYAAQGNSNQDYPWGDTMEESKCNSNNQGTTPVYLYQEGRSPFGCYDMSGNVWEMTESEYSDGRSRFCILKGGSFYQTKGSEWYFDGGALPINFSAKQLLLYPGIDRCQTVGFRCAIDLQ